MADEEIIENPEAMFEGLKKKKKKKKEPLVETVDEPKTENSAESFREQEVPVATAENPETVVDEDPSALFANMKKKKSKKPKGGEEAQVDGEEDTAAPSVPEAESGFDASLFGEKKKKKKRPNVDEFEKLIKASSEGGVASEGREDDGIGKDVEENSANNATGVGEEAWLSSNRDYHYEELLTRVFKIIRLNNPELANKKQKITIPPPQVHREGTRKSVFANVVDIARRMHRTPEHVIQYLYAELGTTGSVDGSQRLVIRGRFQQKQIENVLKRYIVEYVTCKTCKSADTILTKENRLFFVQCESCGSTRTVSVIKTGFQAQTQSRASQRAAA